MDIWDVIAISAIVALLVGLVISIRVNALNREIKELKMESDYFRKVITRLDTKRKND